MALTIDDRTESKLRDLVAEALGESFNPAAAAREACELLAGLMERPSEDVDPADLGMDPIVNADPALVHPEDANIHATALTQIRVERFLKKYEVMVFTHNGHELFPSVCMKCGHPPIVGYGDLLGPSTQGKEEKDPRGWTHLECASHWQKPSKP